MKAKWKERVWKDMGVGAGRLRETLTWSVLEGKTVPLRNRHFIQISYGKEEPLKVRSEIDKEEIRESKKLS